MEIDPDPEKQRCEGILAATGAAGADVGAKVGEELLWGYPVILSYHILMFRFMHAPFLGDQHD